MLTVLGILGVLAVLFVAAAVATREGPILADAPADIADLELPDGPLQPEDLRAVRFALAVRGYRMEEVDRVLERAAAELAERDQRIIALEQTKAGPVAAAAPAAAPAATVGLSKPPVPAAAGDAGEVVEPTAPVVPTEQPEPIVPIEPPLDMPPSPPEPDVPPEPEAPPEPAAQGESAEPAEPADTDDTADRDAEREPVASLLAAPGDGASSSASTPDAGLDEEAVPVTADETSPSEDVPQSAATSEVDTDEPPPAPPIEVAVVATEVAPLPATAARPVSDAEQSAGEDVSAGAAKPAATEGSPDPGGKKSP